MATSIPPTTTPQGDDPPQPAAAIPSPDALEWLDAKHRVWAANVEAWRRDERRREGGDGVLAELMRFDDESDTSYRDRLAAAAYRNFLLSHTSAVVGTLSAHRPAPGAGLSMGTLGDVRERDKVDTPTLGEAVYYNVDGVGADGTEFPVFFDEVDVRAMTTGHRGMLCEMPALADIRAARRAAGEPGVPSDAVSATQADELAGFRPYAVEFSPVDVTNWYVANGEFQFVVIRVPTDAPRLEGGQLTDPEAEKGYYLLVRAGFRGLGPAFAGGGWWLFDAEKAFLRGGTWARTRGRVPFWFHYGDKSRGTAERPAVSRSAGTMLGQLGVLLMNLMSAWMFDLIDAFGSKLMFLNADAGLMTQVAGQKRNIWIGVPSMTVSDGAGGTKELPVTVHDASTGAVAADVARAGIDAIYAAARDESFQQLTSTVDSSGASKQAGFAENKAPYLARRAKLRQQSEQTFLYFAELRAGTVPAGGQPTGYSVYTTDFDLAPVVETIDATLDRMRRAGLRSPTFEVELLKSGAMEDKTWPEDEATQKVVEAELKASAEGAARAAVQGRLQADADAALLTGEGEDGADDAPDDGGGTAPPAP